MINLLLSIFNQINEVSSSTNAIIYSLIGVGSFLILLSIILFIYSLVKNKQDKEKEKKQQSQVTPVQKPIVKTITTKTVVVPTKQTQPIEQNQTNQ